MDNQNTTPKLADLKRAMKHYNANAQASSLTHEQARAARRGNNRAYIVGLVLTIAGLIAAGVLS